MKKLLFAFLLSFPAFAFAANGTVTVIDKIAPQNGAFVGVVDSSQTLTNTTNFNRNLSGTDTTVQKALDTLDDLVATGGSGTPGGTTTYLQINGGGVFIGTGTLTMNTTTNLLTVGATTQFSSVSTTTWTNVSSMTFGNGSALIMSTSTNLQLPSGQLLTNSSSVTAQGVLRASTNITLTPSAGFLDISASGGGSGTSIYAATGTASFPFGFSSSTGVYASTNMPALSITGQYASLESTVTFASQISTVNWNNGNCEYLVLTGTTTLSFSNPQSGGRYLLVLRQDATGSRTVTWPASVHFSNGSTPTLTTTASKEDAVTFFYDGNNAFYLAGYTLNY